MGKNYAVDGTEANLESRYISKANRPGGPGKQKHWIKSKI